MSSESNHLDLDHRQISFMLWSSDVEEFTFHIPSSMVSELVAMFGEDEFAYSPRIIIQPLRGAKIDQLFAGCAL